jgi:TM2 domain-containing membrane protein YozV
MHDTIFLLNVPKVQPEMTHGGTFILLTGYFGLKNAPHTTYATLGKTCPFLHERKSRRQGLNFRNAQRAAPLSSHRISIMGKSILASALSLFVPGLGQLYKGHFIQAVIWFLIVSGAYVTMTWFLFLPIPIFLHLLCILQAFFMDE